jgi:hypothetical protein
MKLPFISPGLLFDDTFYARGPFGIVRRRWIAGAVDYDFDDDKAFV